MHRSSQKILLQAQTLVHSEHSPLRGTKHAVPAISLPVTLQPEPTFRDHECGGGGESRPTRNKTSKRGDGEMKAAAKHCCEP